MKRREVVHLSASPQAGSIYHLLMSDGMGNHHRLLNADINVVPISVKDLDPVQYWHYIGGSVMAARLLLDTPLSKPLAPEGLLDVMTEPLFDTGLPGSFSSVFCARSHLTRIWGESASDGAFVSDLKMSR